MCRPGLPGDTSTTNTASLGFLTWLPPPRARTPGLGKIRGAEPTRNPEALLGRPPPAPRKVGAVTWLVFLSGQFNVLPQDALKP